MEQNPAIIFIHKGNPRYLKFALLNAKKSNPNSNIILLGDNSNSNLSKLCNHHYISDFLDSAEEFKKIYIHQSNNSYDFELFCFQRWFILKDFVIKNQLKHFIACDSDVLIFDDLSQYYDYSTWKQNYLNVVDNNGPQCVYFTKESIINFCNYISNQYSNKIYLERLNNRWKHFLDNKLSGGNCDMTMFTNYKSDFPNLVLNLYGFEKRLKNSFFFYDVSNYESDNKKLFLHEKKRGLIIAKIRTYDKMPYVFGLDGEIFKTPVIHFQGKYKSLMCQYSYINIVFKIIDELCYFISRITNKVKSILNRS